MKSFTIKCPECGGNVVLEEGHDTCFCTYCGAQIALEYPNSKHVTVKKVDEARIVEAEAKRDVKLRELEMQQQTLQNLPMTFTYLKKILIFIIIFGFCGALLMMLIARIGGH